MRIFHVTILLSLLSLSLLTGCNSAPEKHGGDITYLLLWPDDSGRYTFQEITLTTLNSPFELKGEAAEIYFESSLEDNGFTGPIARPHLTKAGNVYVPTDIESAQAVTAYAQFERLYKFEKELGTASQLSWPRRVGVEIILNAGARTGTHNNANYFSKFDSIALLPFSLGEGVPVGMNIGITAHEHFHAHFQQQVVASMSRDLGNVEQLEGNTLRTAHERNNFILRGWNEGLADFFATVYTGNPNFFVDSMPTVAPFRKLDGPLRPFATPEDFRDQLSKPGTLLNYSYEQGTILGRLLFTAANSPGQDQRAFLKTLLLNLGTLPASLGGTYNTKVMTFDQIVPLLFKDIPLNKEICGAIGAVVSEDIKTGSFSQCFAP